MKAVVRGANGSPAVVDVDLPVPTEGEVRVRVHATSVNDFDFFIMRPPLPIRIVGSIGRTLTGAPPRSRIPGCDVAGVVDVVVCATEDALLLKPPRITFEQAAALPGL